MLSCDLWDLFFFSLCTSFNLMGGFWVIRSFVDACLINLVVSAKCPKVLDKIDTREVLICLSHLINQTSHRLQVRFIFLSRIILRRVGNMVL